MPRLKRKKTTIAAVQPDESVGLPRSQFQSLTSAPIRVDCNSAPPEFGRWRDVDRLYGIRRGTLYNLLGDGKIKGVLLRVRGQKSGVRLFDLASIRDYIRQCQLQQECE